MNYRYSLLIQWSEEDQLYLVTIPEFAELVMQPCTAGKSYEEAVQKSQEAIESYLEYCKSEGITPPQPEILSVA
jgi:antitoxin HicB